MQAFPDGGEAPNAEGFVCLCRWVLPLARVCVWMAPHLRQIETVASNKLTLRVNQVLGLVHRAGGEARVRVRNVADCDVTASIYRSEVGRVGVLVLPSLPPPPPPPLPPLPPLPPSAPPASFPASALADGVAAVSDALPAPAAVAVLPSLPSPHQSDASGTPRAPVAPSESSQGPRVLLPGMHVVAVVLSVDVHGESVLASFRRSRLRDSALSLFVLRSAVPCGCPPPSTAVSAVVDTGVDVGGAAVAAVDGAAGTAVGPPLASAVLSATPLSDGGGGTDAGNSSASEVSAVDTLLTLDVHDSSVWPYLPPGVLQWSDSMFVYRRPSGGGEGDGNDGEGKGGGSNG